MAIVRFPVERLGHAERMALRHGVASANPVKPSLRLIGRDRVARAYCAACAAPIDFGAVWRREQVFCSVECSLGGNRPA